MSPSPVAVVLCLQLAGNNFIGACGDVHHPPNITDSHEYDYRILLEPMRRLC